MQSFVLWQILTTYSDVFHRYEAWNCQILPTYFPRLFRPVLKTTVDCRQVKWVGRAVRTMSWPPCVPHQHLSLVYKEVHTHTPDSVHATHQNRYTSKHNECEWVGVTVSQQSTIAISPHSCLRRACPAAHKGKRKTEKETKKGSEKREIRKSWHQLPS